MSFGNNVYNTLNGVNTTTWTPAITFGGSNTGITYTAQSGHYQRLGNIVFYRFTIILSNKGSSTGSARITGLPFASSQYVIGQLAQLDNIDLTANYYTALCKTEITTTNLELFQSGATAADDTIVLTNTNFNNTSLIAGSGFYFV